MTAITMNRGIEASIQIVNPNGEQRVHLVSQVSPEFGAADYAARYGFLTAAKEVGDELFITFSRGTHAPQSAPLAMPIILGILADAGVQTPVFASGYGDPATAKTGPALIVPLPDSIVADPASVLTPLAPAYPPAVVLRWTGAYWLVVSASPGIEIAEFPNHA
ncbi:hypothetical protein CcrKarma_gp084 [Caulobacter virus Karma]|uniref:hypothetical protein n=1 Tax=Caulobacter virus Karma TaxID=1211641 RepID=UPI00028B6F32|nr:hypothetical protein CcrKarma_gp084 [Caulobacter virus Karma]AFU87601.1 hypothetical protein CcrKarma_gp084 [Caulobacter virus Karma]